MLDLYDVSFVTLVVHLIFFFNENNISKNAKIYSLILAYELNTLYNIFSKFVTKKILKY
jgi:hypothetical protein